MLVGVLRSGLVARVAKKEGAARAPPLEALRQAGKTCVGGSPYGETAQTPFFPL